MDQTRYFTEDPFAVQTCLGVSRSAVESVVRRDNSSIVFARKRFALPEQCDAEQFRSIQKEISIMRRLHHTHIIRFGGSYIYSNLFFILMLPVADENLAAFFRRTQSLPKQDPARMRACRQMMRWPACLFRALDYVHSMRIRHKDIKPSNILIKDERVILTDFGISKDFMDLTTSKTDGAAGAATWTYAAPEMDQEQRRGRATDVWALGCVIVELCTVTAGEMTLQEFESYRRADRSGPLASAYYNAPFRLFDWMWLLMGSPGPDNQIGRFVQKALQLAFLMLDPDPQRRITTRQLVDLLSDPRCNDFHHIGNLACTNCQNSIGMSSQDIPLHSVFMQGDDGEPFRPSKEGLSAELPNLWEEIKVRWLKDHIWWVNDPWA